MPLVDVVGVGSGQWDPATAAEVLGVTPDHVRHLCRKGLLIATWHARRWWIDPASVRARLARVQFERLTAERRAVGDIE